MLQFGVNVRIVQMDVSGSVTENAQRAMELSQIHNSSKPDVVVFPEMFVCGFDNPSHIKANAISIDETSFFADYQKICREQEVYFILGSLPIQQDGHLFNTSLVFSPSGKCIHRYDKINLFPLMDESVIFSPGGYSPDGLLDKFTLNLGGEKFESLIRICYDLRFPEIFRNPKACQYPDIIFLPMQWPAPRTNIFRTLAQARAIENQAYVVVCNRVGNDYHNSFEGKSFVIRPDGNILGELGEKEGYLDIDLDKNWLIEFRSQYPFLNKQHEGAISN